MTIRRAMQKWHFLRHIRPQQVFWRIFYLIRCKVIKSRPLPRDAARPVASVLPHPLLQPRPTTVSTAGKAATFTFLNRPRSMSFPIDWEAFEHMESHLWGFHLHYMEYLESLNGPGFEKMVTDWIKGNPVTRKNARHTSWSAYVISLRTVVWMQQVAMRRPQLSIEFLSSTISSIHQQLYYLEHNLELDLGGNHLLKNIKALLWSGRFFTGKEAKRWHRKGKCLLAREMKEQFLPDGMHYERSPAYHCQVFADLLDCWVAIGEDDVGLEAVIHKAAEALAVTTHPDGLPSLFNDGGLHMAYAPSILLDTYEKIFNRRPPAHSSFALPQAGYYGFRSERLYLLADCGDIGPDFLVAHGHGDTLAFEMTVDGKRFIVDQGVFEYDPGEKRDISRTTSSHNTAEINNQSQSDFFGSFRVGRRARAKCLRYEPSAIGFTLAGTHDGYDHLKGQPRHIRQFDVTETGVRIQDEISSARPYQARAFLLLGPGISVKKQNGGVDLSGGDTKVHLETTAPFVIEDTVWFPDFGVEQATRRLIFDYGMAPARHYIHLTVQDKN